MKNLKISRKLLVTFGIVIGLVLCIAVGGIYTLFILRDGASELYDLASPVIELGESMETLRFMRGLMWETVIHTGDAGELDRIERELNQAIADFGETMGIYSPSVADADLRGLYDNIMGLFDTDISPAFLGAVAAARNGASADELMGMIGGADTICDKVTDGLNQLLVNRKNVMDETNARNFAFANIITAVVVVGLSIVIIITFFLGWRLSALIGKPLSTITAFVKKAGATGDISLRPEDIENISKLSQQRDEIGELSNGMAGFVQLVTDASETLGKIADGDLTVDIEMRSDKDTIGVSLRDMVNNLNDMFSEISAASAQVTVGAGQVAQGSQTLAQGSTEQASSVEELSASVTEVSEKTKQNAKMAIDATTLSSTIKTNAEKGSIQMDSLMQAVSEINEASNSISKVIKVIDDIAFQTNILALNAAVEAARAGQHGKGFAVVAEEVRNLASKSAEAAKDTGGMIENTIEKATLGMNTAKETSASLKEIVDGINQSAEIITQIARSSDEQANAITQINTGIDQVSQVIQQNSATTEESAAASEEMSGQAALLQENISRFKLKDTDRRIAELPPKQIAAAVPVQKQRAMSAYDKDSISSGNNDFGKY